MPDVIASDFASIADLRAYQHAKALGWSDARAFGVGDNGIGCWGDFTATESTPMCALPYEDWQAKWGDGATARGKRVRVALPAGRSVICELRDTMPHRAHITNGCGIDLNPGALRCLGLESPVKTQVYWEWVADTGQPVTDSNWLEKALAAL